MGRDTPWTAEQTTYHNGHTGSYHWFLYVLRQFSSRWQSSDLRKGLPFFFLILTKAPYRLSGPAGVRENSGAGEKADVSVPGGPPPAGTWSPGGPEAALTGGKG